MSFGLKKRGQFSRSSLLILLVALGLLSTQEASMAAKAADSGNLVQNGSFEVAGKGNVPQGWTVTGAAGDVKTDAIDPNYGNVSLKMQAKAGQSVRLTQVVNVKPGSILLFTAAVKSPDRVVATIRKVRMAYHRQGQWQTLVGVINTQTDKKLTINIDLRGLSKDAPTMKLDAVTLRPIDVPADLPRKFDTSLTHLIENGRPAATIIYPSTIPQYKALAEQVRKAIAQRGGGVMLPILSDVEATQAPAPVLKKELAEQNLILIGRLGINRAMWPAYNRFQMAADGYYPGGNGYVVRTAANVMRNGKNQIILGGSSDAGAAAAVQAFVEKELTKANASNGSLSLPWLLDTRIEGDCLAALKANDALWTTDPLNSKLPPVEAGKGTIRRWYQNAMGYYWTGWASYKTRAVDLLKPILADQAYNHHYVDQFFVRTWDMLDDSPLFSREQQAAVDKLLLDNFLRFCTGAGDVTWMTTFSPPYDDIKLVNRHQIEPWMADLTMADYFRDYIKLSGDVAQLVTFRQSEKDSFMRYMAAQRWDESLPGIGMSESKEQTAISIARFALERGDYTLFESGHARHLPGIPFINLLTGSWVRPPGGFNSKLLFGILASYYHDGRYLTLARDLPSAAPFFERTLCGIHDYTPGTQVQPQSADSFTGVDLPPMMPQRMKDIPGLHSKQFSAIKFPAAQVFDFASLRSGFDADDDYVALNGLNLSGTIPGIFLSFCSRGTDWFAASKQFASSADRYFDQNGVFVIRTDQLSGKTPPYSAAAKLDWSADLHRAGDVCFTLDPFVGMRWQRDVVWVRPGLYLVRDQLAAKQAGQFQVGVNWRPAGAPAWDGRTWTSTSRTGAFRLTPLGEGFQIQQNVKAFLADQEAQLYLRQTASATLKANQSIDAIAVLQALHPGKEAALTAQLVGKNAVYLSAKDHPTDNVLIAWDGQPAAGVTSDARVAVVRSNAIQIIGGTHLEIDGKPIVKSDRPINLAADFAAGTLQIDNPEQSGKQNIHLIGADGTLGAPINVTVGKSRIELPKALVQLPAMAAPTGSVEVATASANENTRAATQKWPVQNETAQWKPAWRYSGLQLPMPVNPARRLPGDVIDFGRVVHLAEIDLAPPPRGRGAPEPLPADIQFSVGDAAGNPPPADSALWKKVDQSPQWLSGAFTGNYGYIRPSDQYRQVLRLKDVKARYVRAGDTSRLVFFDADNQGAPLPLEIHFTGEKNRLLIAPHIWPKFVGLTQYWEDKLAMLDLSGKEIFQYTCPTKMENVELLPLNGEGPKSVVVPSIAGRIVVLKPDGSVGRDMNLFAMHEAFNKQFGHPGTTHPAGLYARPFSVGLWRQSAASAPSWVIARYHCFSFLNNDGTFEGLLQEGSYVQPVMLPEGIDFNGDGKQEQLCLGNFVIQKLSGPLDRRISEPTGNLFYPQIYHTQRLAEPASSGHGVDGSPVRMFQPVQIERSAPTRPRYVAVAREPYVALYDGLKNTWAWSWAPLVSVRAAAVVADTPQHLRILAATEDGLLWDLNFDGATARPSKFNAKAFPGQINRIAPDTDGAVLIAANSGLYRLDTRDNLQLIAPGPFTDARPTPGAANSILAVQGDGEVLRLDPAKP
jgi:hypothetical protein